jgi:hypothetical protein
VPRGAERFVLNVRFAMRNAIYLGLLLSLTLVGCGSVADDAKGDASTSETSSTDTGAETTPARGGGVCCPLTASTGCSPHGYFGGWAASNADCREDSAFDGCPFVEQTDSHGCAVLVAASCTTMCGVIVDTGVPDPSFDTGGADEHGCIGSAGYQWCAKEMKCERPWELAAEKGFPNTAEGFATYCGS